MNRIRSACWLVATLVCATAVIVSYLVFEQPFNNSYSGGIIRE
jgi:hypothetical protein